MRHQYSSLYSFITRQVANCIYIICDNNFIFSFKWFVYFLIFRILNFPLKNSLFLKIVLKKHIQDLNLVKHRNINAEKERKPHLRIHRNMQHEDNLSHVAGLFFSLLILLSFHGFEILFVREEKVCTKLNYTPQ